MQSIAKSATFYASFDGGTDADYARGDAHMFWAPSMTPPRVGKSGLPDGGQVKVEPSTGRFGGSLHYVKKFDEILFFRGKDNVPYRSTDWNGSYSLWLRTAPDSDLPMGFTDAIQITPRQWDDASFFLEFERRAEDTPFRLGAYADFSVWNPNHLKWDTMPLADKPIIAVPKPPIRGDQWMHAVMTFEHFNSGKPNGVVRLYVNGDLQGALSPRVQTYTWDLEKTLLMLGIGYVGYIDEVAVFDRALSAKEVQTLFQSKTPLSSWIHTKHPVHP